VWNPRNNNYNAGGADYGSQNQQNTSQRGGRGGFSGYNKNPRGQQPNHFNNAPSGGNNRNQGFTTKQKSQNKGFRGGGGT
jgi:hypothetical protein